MGELPMGLVGEVILLRRPKNQREIEKVEVIAQGYTWGSQYREEIEALAREYLE